MPARSRPTAPSGAGQQRLWPAGPGGSAPQRDAAADPGITDATSVASGGAFSCALRAGGSVVCWGQNLYGQLGRGSVSTTAAGNAKPEPVNGLSGVAIDCRWRLPRLRHEDRWLGLVLGQQRQRRAGRRLRDPLHLARARAGAHAGDRDLRRHRQHVRARFGAGSALLGDNSWGSWPSPQARRRHPRHPS